jgi:hypothetical protein
VETLDEVGVNMATRTPRPILEIEAETIDYIKSYTLSIKRQPNYTYTLRAKGLNEIIEFAKLMRTGIYGARVATGMMNDDQWLEVRLIEADIKVL